MEIVAWQIVLLFFIVFMHLVFFCCLAWVVLKCIFKDNKLVIMGFYGGHHKTVAMGLPLIKAIYEDDPRLGLYALPLLIWHPMQLIFGSALAPKLAAWSKAQEEKKEER